MRKINNIVVHCTATPQSTTVDSILNFWKNKLKWKSPGYHYIILADGEIINLLHVNKISNGVAGHNSNSINVAYIGGVDKYLKPFDNRTEQQKEALLKILTKLKSDYPTARILGHRDFQNVTKACPSFDAIEEYKYL